MKGYCDCEIQGIACTFAGPAVPCCPANWEELRRLPLLRKLLVPWLAHKSVRLKRVVKSLPLLREVRFVGVEAGDRVRPPTDAGLNLWSDGGEDM